MLPFNQVRHLGLTWLYLDCLHDMFELQLFVKNHYSTCVINSAVKFKSLKLLQKKKYLKSMRIC
jgi:hypothetical protein